MMCEMIQDKNPYLDVSYQENIYLSFPLLYYFD